MTSLDKADLNTVEMLPHRLVTILCLAGIGQTSRPAGPEPASPQRKPPAVRQPGEDRSASRREAIDRFIATSPAERDRQRIERLVAMAARTYALDEIQKSIVRNELESMQAERRASMGPDADEYDKLREEMAGFWKQPEDADSTPEARRAHWRAVRESDRFRLIQKRLTDLENAYRIDPEKAIERVERLLPPDQVEKGRARRQQRLDAARQRQSRRLESPPATTQPADAPQPTPAAPPLHPWDEYTRRFIAERSLTEPQANAARSMLKDVQTRAAQIEKTQADRRAQAQATTDETARKKLLDDLDKPYEDLFEELKSRLDALLNAAQRAAMNP